VASNDQKEIQMILKDLAENEDKVKHHGKRAEDIVKGMLQHSRANSGAKELTDINGLADEYLRLAFHGFRAKDKSFNAEYKLDLDKSLPKLSIVPQDIGRVLLNLINNAFYAIDRKAKKSVNGYKPLVAVSTRMAGNKVEIIVKDNGEGIPENIRDKIFQPFFTTKPTGKGTGLGLSLSYDIVKGHGGEIKIESIEGEGTEFTIVLKKDAN
jgi:signal transduction histidine kinase